MYTRPHPTPPPPSPVSLVNLMIESSEHWDGRNPFSHEFREMINQILIDVSALEQAVSVIESILERGEEKYPGGPNDGTFSAIIGAASGGTENIWDYEWEEVALDSTGDAYVVVPVAEGGRSHVDSGLAKNLAEYANTTQIINYGQAIKSDSQTSITVMEIAAGSVVDNMRLVEYLDAGGATQKRARFTASPNPILVACSERPEATPVDPTPPPPL